MTPALLPTPLAADDLLTLDAWLRDLAPCMETAADDADPLLNIERDEAPALPWEREWTPRDTIVPGLIPAPALCDDPPWLNHCAAGDFAHGVGVHGASTIRWRGQA